MNTFKPFDLGEIDETLTRVVTHGSNTYLLFPYINGTRSTPAFNSIARVIKGPAATVEDFHALSELVKQAGANAMWLISFSTPWLLPIAESASMGQRPRQSRAERP
jgi:hypothetical protein